MLGANFHRKVLNEYVLAGDKNCSAEQLAELAKSETDKIRRRVAENPNTPTAILKYLATDKNADVRIAVGTNPSTPEHIRYNLACDQDPTVRIGLAEDMTSPVEIIEKLIEDENPYVSYQAHKTKDLVSSIAQPRNIGCHHLFRQAAKGINQHELKYA